MSHLVIGLMSGTSLDGIDAALVKIDRRSIKLLEFETYPYPQGLAGHILKISAHGGGSAEDICRLNALLGELFAQASLNVISKAGIKPSDVHLIGSHGQTVQHLPNPVELFGFEIKSTLQLGEPSVIAQRTGITAVADFRPADMAAGGEGAPLLPLLHYRLFHGDEAVIVQNIGGIGNLTFIPANAKIDDILAFDTGPGNMLIDGLVRHYTKGNESFDKNGAYAANGKLCEPLLNDLMRHPFLAQPPPKTCGREEFGEELIEQILDEAEYYKLSMSDILQTVTAFSAQSIAESYKKFIFPKDNVKKILLCGGGRKNLTLMFMLQAMLDVPISPVDDYGINGDALEAMGFALLAHETMSARPGNIPSATGANLSVPLGKIVWGKNFKFWQEAMK